jgi:hypothetical protein
MIAADPNQGGAAWAVLQYVIGLEQLGHDVLLVEPWKLAEEAADAVEDSESAAYFRAVAKAFDIADRAALLVVGTDRTVGLPYDELVARAGAVDVLLNISGMLADERLTASIPVRAYLDLDPAFNQLWQMQGIDMRFDGHTHFVTVGQAIGTPHSPIPTCGLDWIATLPPVVLERWPPGEEVTRDAFTTIGNFRGYGSVEHEGVHYGQKVHSLRELFPLPRRSDARFELAFAIHPDETRDLEALEDNGWELVDPVAVAGTPDQYREFIRGSLAELGIAKSGYVLSRSGWFSDRSACYLASGRPVVAQETGFSRFLPAGEGLLAFTTLDGAVAAIEEVRRDYLRHSQAARAIAEERLDSDLVLTSLLERLGVP